MSRNLDFLTQVDRVGARNAARGRVAPETLVGRSPMHYRAESFGPDNPVRGSHVNWSASRDDISIADSADAHPADAPIAITQKRLPSGRVLFNDVEVRDPAVVRPRGIEVARKVPVNLRGWEKGTHWTSEEPAEGIADLVSRGKHGLLASNQGASGSGIYTIPENLADDFRTYGDVRIDGVMNPGYNALEHSDPHVRASAKRVMRDGSRFPDNIESWHSSARESMRARGAGYVPDKGGAKTLLHPSQFRVTSITHGDGRRQEFDPTEQHFAPGDPVMSPRTFVK